MDLREIEMLYDQIRIINEFLVSNYMEKWCHTPFIPAYSIIMLVSLSGILVNKVIMLIMQIKKVAQGCQLGNSAKIVSITIKNTNK